MGTALSPPGSENVLYLIDLSSYVLRAYHAIAELRGPTGEPTHAVHGVVNMLERLIRERQPRLLAVAMDSGRATFRQELYPDYKANRPSAPPDLRQQLSRCEEIVNAYRIPIFKLPGVEADDLIATVVSKAKHSGLGVVIVGADKDLMQLVSNDVVLYDTMRDKVFGPAEVEARFGVKLHQLRDLLALCGDSSDNIPGVPSVGPKTARDLLLSYGSLEGIYENLNDIKRKKLKETLESYRAQAELSRQLVTLKDDCSITWDVAALRREDGRDVPHLIELYRELGFTRQLAALEQEQRQAPAQAAKRMPAKMGETRATLIKGLPELLEVVKAARASGTLAIEAHAPTLTHQRALVGLGLSGEPGTGAYLPLAHRYLGAPVQLELATVMQTLAPILADPTIVKAGHDLKRTRVLLRRTGFEELAGFAADTALAGYLMDPEASHALESLTKQELQADLVLYESLTKRGRGQQLDFDELAVEEALRFAAPRVDAIARLVPLLHEHLEELGLTKLYTELELPLTSLLTEMELLGVLVDVECLRKLGERCQIELIQLEQEAHRVAGREFNVNSPRQLETLLFDELGLKPMKRTKTSRSTDAATLEALAEQHALPKIVLEIRQLSKLKGTYIDALPHLVDAKTGRIHCTWGQTTAATGRLSSTDPNLQNIPIRSALGREIRAAFVAPPGYTLVSADYSQIELRILAHLSQDPLLLEAFRTGQDIHTRTAMEIFDLSESEVTREHRTRAKAVNFGVIYGQGESGLAKALGIPRAEAADFIAAYFRRYQGVREFMKRTLDRARDGEAVRSILGRRRLLPEIRSGNRARRLAAERIAMNMPIQGSAADVLKLAMLSFERPVTPGTRMVLTVHDELVFEVPDAEVAEAMPKIKLQMEQAYPLDVPMVVDVGAGKDWRSAH